MLYSMPRRVGVLNGRGGGAEVDESAGMGSDVHPVFTISFVMESSGGFRLTSVDEGDPWNFDDLILLRSRLIVQYSNVSLACTLVSI